MHKFRITYMFPNSPSLFTYWVTATDFMDAARIFGLKWNGRCRMVSCVKE